MKGEVTSCVSASGAGEPRRCEQDDTGQREQQLKRTRRRRTDEQGRCGEVPRTPQTLQKAGAPQASAASR